MGPKWAPKWVPNGPRRRARPGAGMGPTWTRDMPNLDQGHAQPGSGTCPTWTRDMPNLDHGHAQPEPGTGLNLDQARAQPGPGTGLNLVHRITSQNLDSIPKFSENFIIESRICQSPGLEGSRKSRQAPVPPRPWILNKHFRKFYF